MLQCCVKIQLQPICNLHIVKTFRWKQLWVEAAMEQPKFNSQSWVMMAPQLQRQALHCCFPLHTAKGCQPHRACRAGWGAHLAELSNRIHQAKLASIAQAAQTPTAATCTVNVSLYMMCCTLYSICHSTGTCIDWSESQLLL